MKFKIGQTRYWTPSGLFVTTILVKDVYFRKADHWIHLKDFESNDEEFWSLRNCTPGALLFFDIEEPCYCSPDENELHETLQQALKTCKVWKSCPGRERKKLLRRYREVYSLLDDYPEFLRLPDKKVYVRRR